MPERLALLAVVVGLVVVAVLLARRLAAKRSVAVTQRPAAWDALGTEPDGRRTLVAFSTPSCAACHKAQSPAIQLATDQLGGEQVRVIRVDSAEKPHIARAFGVLTVPSTVVIEAAGDRIVAINQGFAPSSRLVEQLQQA